MKDLQIIISDIQNATLDSAARRPPAAMKQQQWRGRRCKTHQRIGGDEMTNRPTVPISPSSVYLRTDICRIITFDHKNSLDGD
jgi:hypothetical protein